MDAIQFTNLHYYLLILFVQFMLIEPYTLTPSQSIIDGESLISQDGTFKLGFFSPSSSSRNRYLGIWYNTISTQTVVWVANRDAPVFGTSGVFKIGSSGNLVIVVNHTVVWSSSKPSTAVETPILEFFKSGNLVLRNLRNSDAGSYLWQSFDHPTDTLLPGMKVGWNVKTGINRHLTSWKKFDDPSSGDFTYGIELLGHPEFFVRSRSEKYYRPGSWNGVQDTGSPERKASLKFTFYFVHNAEETYFTYKLVNPLLVWRLVLTQTSSEGRIQRLAWADSTKSWVLQVSVPRDRCDDYGLCGVYSSCDLREVEVCQCLKGFKPRTLADWNQSDWSQGCERKIPVNCNDGEGFVKHSEVKLPETTGSWVNASMNLEECRVKCLKNCSCMAYSNSDIRDGGSGCILWFTDLIDMRHLSGAGQDIYIRMAASELDVEVNYITRQHEILIESVTLVAGVIAFGLGSWFIWKKKRSVKQEGGRKKKELDLPLNITSDDIELPLYDFSTIALATSNFSTEKKLGEGGFGPVYKGMLEGQEIAVKRLSKDSIQGVDEFRNEVILISKLQHRNLVRILGYCIHREEKILVYEYMQNRSLDSFIFDETKSRLLDWQKRFQIILGIARGILYLHHDSRLRIIHRDIKGSNILLDHEMVPKISDFGMARIFSGDQNEARTKRVIGTRGYMSPEYVLDGRFSEKSDVFSFGVLVLEIISGKRNRGFSHPEHDLNLLGHAWRLWNEGKSMEMVDESMRTSCIIDEVSRCVHIGLLCVQKGRLERPTMWSVMLMLSSETELQQPRPPGFYMERSTSSKENSSNKDPRISNDCSITLLEGR